MIVIKASTSEAKTRLSHYLSLVKEGEEVVICRRGQPIAKLVPIGPPMDVDLRESAFGRFNGVMTEAELNEALRPMTDDR